MTMATDNPLARTLQGRTGRSALGKGLGALIPSARTNRPQRDFFSCAIGSVSPDPNQPRQQFDDAALEELTQSVKDKGVLQPIVVRRHTEQPGSYIVVAGERRLRAARKAGLEVVPVLVKDIASDEAFELALIENIQREDLNAIEEASAYQRLMDDGKMTQEALAERLGKNRSTVANALRLLRLDSAHQQLLIDRQLSAGHARCLLAIEDRDARATLADRIVTEKLNVRAAEDAVREAKACHQTPKAGRGRAQRTPSASQLACDEIARELGAILNAPIEVKARGRAGRMTIGFRSLDELRELRDRLSRAGLSAA